MKQIYFRWFFLICTVLVTFSSSVNAGSLIVQHVSIPFNETIMLDANIYWSKDNTTHPLVIINHGRAASEIERKNLSPEFFTHQAQWFVDRGFTVIVPIRRGYGKSGGADLESANPYNPYKTGLSGADDIKAVLQYVKNLNNIDSKRVVLVGQSCGGLVSVAATSQELEGVIGVVNFAGGLRKNFSSNDGAKNLFEAFELFGQTSKTPMLWIYTVNDQLFPPFFANGMYKAFTEAGGSAKLIHITNEAGHAFFYRRESISIWGSYVDEFMTALGLINIAK